MAGGFGGTSEDELIAGINVTPLVDVTLVLLIIFLITAPVIYRSAIKVALPSAKTGEQIDQSPINFSITKDGALFWDKDQITWDVLPAKLATLKDRAGSLTAIINADKATPHGTVVELMDALRDAGLTRMALTVSSEAPSKPR